MFRKLTMSILLMACAIGCFAQGETTLYNTIKADYSGKADSMVNAFIETFMDKSRSGVFDDRYKQYAFNAYWTQAHAMDVVVYCYERHMDDEDQTLAKKYKNYMAQWYARKANNYMGAAASSSGTYQMFENNYTDDMCWIALTLLHMNEATGISKYYNAAKGIFDYYIIKRAIEDEETGGLKLPWSYDTEANKKAFNACTQSPATLIAIKLYAKTENTKYLEYAKKLYLYTSKKIVYADYRVEDPPLTYTQGTFAEACRWLFHYTDEGSTQKNRYKNLAYNYLNYAFTSGRCTNGQNILRDEGSNGDQSIFKAVLCPYAANFVADTTMTTTNRKNIANFMHKNAAEMYKHLNWSRYPIVFCHYDWTKEWTGADNDASMGAMCSGTSLLENTARMDKLIIKRYEEYQKRTGIDDLLYEGTETPTGVYSLEGRLVRTPWQGTKGLKRGLYIVNGKKVLVP